MPALTKGDFSALTDIYAPIQVPLMRIQQNPTVLKDYDETFPVFNEMAMNQNVGFDAEWRILVVYLLILALLWCCFNAS